MPEKRANARVKLGADDVLEPACLSVRLGFVDGKSVFKQTLGQAMAAHYVARALAPRGSKAGLIVARIAPDRTLRLRWFATRPVCRATSEISSSRSRSRLGRRRDRSAQGREPTRARGAAVDRG